MIIEDIGFWERAGKDDVDAIVCTTNNVVKMNGALVMGAGIAKAFKETFPYLDLNWGEAAQASAEGGNTDYGVLIDGPRMYNRTKIFLVAFQTKRDWAKPSDLELIQYSAQKLAALADILNWQRIICPAFGCSNGQLTWGEVEKKIKKILDDRFIIVGLSPDGVI